MNNSNSNIPEEMENSPRVGLGAHMVPPTPDDKDKDPDWVNPWVRTPLKAKNRGNTSFTSFLKKVSLD